MIGASAGIGASTAVEFAKEGAKLSIKGRNAENLNKTGKKCEEAGLSKDDVGILTSVSISYCGLFFFNFWRKLVLFVGPLISLGHQVTSDWVLNPECTIDFSDSPLV